MATLPETPEINAISIFLNGIPTLILSLERPFVNTYLSLFLTYVIFFAKKAGLQGFIKKIITPEPLQISN
jgi:hypothetical protein